MQQDFKPVAYMKSGCPFCFKLRLALLELGLIDDVEIRTFSPGTLQETEIRQRISGTMAKVSFPTVEILPDVFKTESDELIEYFAESKGIDTDALPTLQAYISGPFAKLMRLSKENKELTKARSA